jgi:hypothetical protein
MSVENYVLRPRLSDTFFPPAGRTGIPHLFSFR